MASVLTVIGATGKQGSSVVNAALKNGTYKIRAVTRNLNSEKAKALATLGVELVTADVNDEHSLLKAFEVSSYSSSYLQLLPIADGMRVGINCHLCCHGLL
jgi:putative NADH-flavin reductase